MKTYYDEYELMTEYENYRLTTLAAKGYSLREIVNFVNAQIVVDEDINFEKDCMSYSEWLENVKGLEPKMPAKLSQILEMEKISIEVCTYNIKEYCTVRNDDVTYPFKPWFVSYDDTTLYYEDAKEAYNVFKDDELIGNMIDVNELNKFLEELLKNHKK